MARFFNNAAHSNGNTGLAVNRRLGDGHTIIGCSTYTPLVDPSDKRSEYQPIYFDTFHGRMKRRCYAMETLCKNEIFEINRIIMACRQ